MFEKVPENEIFNNEGHQSSCKEQTETIFETEIELEFVGAGVSPKFRKFVK